MNTARAERRAGGDVPGRPPAPHRARSSAPRRASCRPPRRRAGPPSGSLRPRCRATPCAGRRCASRDDRPPASPATAAPGKRQHDQRHQRQKRDAEGNGTPRFAHVIDRRAGQPIPCSPSGSAGPRHRQGATAALPRARGSWRCPSVAGQHRHCHSTPSGASRQSSRGRAAGRPGRRWRRRRWAPPRTARAVPAPRRPRTGPAPCCARGSPRYW